METDLRLFIVIQNEKNQHLAISGSRNNGGEGEIAKAAPSALPLRCLRQLKLFLTIFRTTRMDSGTWICRSDARWFSHFPKIFYESITKKPDILRYRVLGIMAVRERFELSKRFRLHAFQACSFGHSDTSPSSLTHTT